MKGERGEEKFKSNGSGVVIGADRMDGVGGSRLEDLLQQSYVATAVL